MYSDGYAPQLIHDVKQLLKLKDTVEELKKNPDEWIRKYQVETDDPLTLEQLKRILHLSRLNHDEQHNLFLSLKKTKYFPENMPVEYSCEKMSCTVSKGDTLLYRTGDIKINMKMSSQKENEFINKLERFHSSPEPMTIILTGIQGSGKSTLAKVLEEKCIAVCFSNDSLGREFWNCKQEIGVNGFLNERNRLVKLALSKGKSVVWDNINTSVSMRNYISNMGKEYGKSIIIYMDLPYDECLNRAILRDSHVPQEYIQSVLQYTYHDFEPPTLDSHAADAIITNHYDETSKSYTISIESRNETFKDELQEIIQIINQVNIIL